MEDEDAIDAGEGFARADQDAPEGGPDAETFELELDGRTHTLPAALKGAFLRQADYTRKTQELATHRRALEGERQALAAERQMAAEGAHDRAVLAALEQQMADYASIDWRALGQADPERAHALWASFQETQALRERFAQALSHHAAHEQVRAAREAAEAMAATGQQLRQEIDGWSPEVAAKLVEYAQAFGVTTDELSQMADPRLWKLLHKAYQADQAGQRDVQTAAQAVRPAAVVAGGGAGGGGVRDELSTKEWMRRRNEQMRKAR